MMTKTALMEMVISGQHHEAFTHSEMGTYDITLMRNAAKDVAELIEVPLYLIVGFIRTNRVTEARRVHDLPDAAWQDDPGMFIHLDEGTDLLVDGHHRALRRELEGKTHMKFWSFPQAFAIRPLPGFGSKPEHDWGDALIDGKIVRRPHG